MQVIIIILTAVCIIESVCIFVMKKQELRLYHDLTDVFTDAVSGNKDIVKYDESVLSALSDNIIRYIDANKSRLSDIEKYRNNINILISNITHQISTPISNITLYTDLLLENNVHDETIRQMLSEIKLQTDKLSFLFEVFRKTSRLESGLIAINDIKRQPVKPLICEAVSELYHSINEKKIDLSINADNGISASFDIKWTKEVIYNILENAVKYTDTDGKIFITVTPSEMVTRIDIKDTGIGIKEDEYTKIFSRFYRSPDVKEYNGVGIGLYIARQIISMQGGYIKVSSEPGKGSIFSVFLPR